MENTKIAKNYAKALFDNALELECTKEVFTQITTLQEAIASDKAALRAFISPIIPPKQKMKILYRVLEQFKFKSIVGQFLRVLTENSRGGLLGEIIDEYQNLLNISCHVKVVHVTSARPLKKEDQDFIKEYLTKEVPQKVELKITEDKGIIGGIILRYDSKIIDCSIAGAIKKIEQSINGY